jgi:hypothetical protein
MNRPSEDTRWIGSLNFRCHVHSCHKSPDLAAYLSFSHQCDYGCEHDGKVEFCIVPHLYCLEHKPSLDSVLDEEGWNETAVAEFKKMGRDVPKDIVLNLFHIRNENVLLS